MRVNDRVVHDTIRDVAVLGAGTMGSGIAVSFAADGLSVALYDIDEKMLTEARATVDTAVDTLETHGRLSAEEAERVPDRVEYVTSLPDAVEGRDFVTEAVVEDISIKRDVFGRLADAAPDDAILATNTSGLSITEIAEGADDPSRVVGTHWFNPAYIVPLVEVVHGEETDQAVADVVYELLDDLGKTPVMVEKDIPGFIGNRIQMAMMYEAFSLLDRGVATPEAIDRAVKAGFGFRLPSMGIFEKADQSGLDVQYDVESYLMRELDRGTEPNPVVTRLVEDGSLGLKSGKGVYDWSDVSPQEVYERRDRELLSLRKVYDEELEQ